MGKAQADGPYSDSIRIASGLPDGAGLLWSDLQFSEDMLCEKLFDLQMARNGLAVVRIGVQRFALRQIITELEFVARELSPLGHNNP